MSSRPGHSRVHRVANFSRKGTIPTWGMRLSKVWVNNSGLIVGAVLSFLTVWNILALSGFDVETAQFVLQEQGTSTVIVGSLFSVMTYLASFAVICVIVLPLFLSILRSLRSPVKSPPTRPPAEPVVYFTTSLFAVILAAMTVPLEMLVIVGGITLLALASLYLADKLNRREAKRAGPQPTARNGGRVPSNNILLDRQLLAPAVLAFAVMAAAYMVFADPWLPHEKVVSENSETKIVYVLSDSAQELVYIDARSRQVRRMDAAAVSNRTICSVSDTWTKPFTSRPGDYPPCEP